MNKPIICLSWAVISSVLLYSCVNSDPGTPGRVDPVEEKVSQLMGKMTLEEKIAQMCQYVAPEHIARSKKRIKGDELIHNDQWGLYPGVSVEELKQWTREGKVGSFLHVKDAKEANELQRLALESRLKIPLLIGIDAIHGHAMITGSTVFPTQLGLSSTWDNDLLYRVARATAKEVRATGMHWNFSPNVEVGRDPRWGRIGETFGEDPFMVTRMGLAFTEGYQGDFGPDNVLACAKHFIAGSEPYNGTNASPMDVSMRQLREIWLPPFAAQAKAGVYTFMAAHNEVSGVPSHSHKQLMTDILREEWGFDGFVVSDWMDIERLVKTHRVAKDQQEAVKLSVNAGIDMHMHGPGFLEPLAALVRSGEVPEERVDEACRSILRAKFMLGLFEDPFIDENASEKALFSPGHRDLALEAARKSVILLKNDNLLPLKDQGKILITGPNAHNHRVMGDWALEQPEENILTIYEGFDQVFTKARVDFINSGESLRSPDAGLLENTIRGARGYDAIVAVVGSNSLRYERGEKTAGENVGRSTLALLGNQLELIQKLYEVNPNVIVVLVNGRPLSEPWIEEHIPAVIEAWEPGAFAGQAVAEVVKGVVNPSGKLTVTFPYHAGQIPMVYNHKPSNFFHRYIDSPSEPLWHFGHGLSYTTFHYAPPVIDKKSTEDGNVTVSCQVTNAGSVHGDEIVQLYVRDDFSSVTRPVKELKGYERVSLDAGETKTVTFDLAPTDLAFYNLAMEYMAEEGTFTVMVGSSSNDKDLQKVQFELAKTIRLKK